MLVLFDIVEGWGDYDLYCSLTPGGDQDHFGFNFGELSCCPSLYPKCHLSQVGDVGSPAQPVTEETIGSVSIGIMVTSIMRPRGKSNKIKRTLLV